MVYQALIAHLINLHPTYTYVGIEALVDIQGHDDEKLRTLTAQLLELMADVKSTEEVTDRTLDMGVEQLMKLCLLDNNEPIQVCMHICMDGMAADVAYLRMYVYVRN